MRRLGVGMSLDPVARVPPRPAFLRAGQEASDKIFKGENRGKTSVKTNVKGGRTTLRK